MGEKMRFGSKVFLSLVITLAIILSVNLVSASVSIDKPSASSVTGGTNIELNVTFTDAWIAQGDSVNISFYAKSSLSANTTWVRVGGNRTVLNTLNLTGTNNTHTFTNLTTGVLEDANDYIFNVTIEVNNATAQMSRVMGTDTNTVITVDNTVPQVTSLSPVANTKDTDGSVTFSATASNTTRTSACTLYFPQKNPGSSSYTMTASGDTCTHTLTLPEESYEWYISASDGTNTTASSRINVISDISTSAGKTASLITQKGIKSGGGATLTITSGNGNIPGTEIPIWIVVVGALVAGIVIYVIYKRR